MENSINLTASKIDLMTLEELRDPNLISRYPPLFQRRQHYVAVDDNSQTKFGRSLTQQHQNRSKVYETAHLALFNYPQSQSQAPAQRPPEQSEISLNSTSSHKETTEKKPHRSSTLFFKHRSKKTKKLERQETLRRSISKPYLQANDQKELEQPTNHSDTIEPIYVHALYPYRTKRSIKIKRDVSLSPDESRNDQTGVAMSPMSHHRLRVIRGQTRLPNSPGQQLSAINSLVVPPVGSSQIIGNPANYSSTIVHPNMRQDQLNNNNRQQLNFIRYDMMNLDNSNALSPIINESEFTSAQVNQQPSHNLNEILIPTSTFFVPTTSDSDESYYSVEDEVPHFATVSNTNDIRVHACSQQQQQHHRNHHHQHHHIRQVSSPLYRFNDSQTTRYALPFARQSDSPVRGR